MTLARQLSNFLYQDRNESHGTSQQPQRQCVLVLLASFARDMKLLRPLKKEKRGDSQGPADTRPLELPHTMAMKDTITSLGVISLFAVAAIGAPIWVSVAIAVSMTFLLGRESISIFRRWKA